LKEVKYFLKKLKKHFVYKYKLFYICIDKNILQLKSIKL